MIRKIVQYLFALSLAAGVVAGVDWAMRAGPPRPSAGIETASAAWSDQGYRFKTLPAGADSPASDCVVCHSLEKAGTARLAPSLWNIVGAPKARAGWFAYSAALRKAGGTWTVEALDHYLESPSTFLPGTIKTIAGIRDPAARAKLIRYLGTLRD